MIDKFNHFILSENLISSNQRILLAVSGGIDSMCMLDLFRKSNFEIGVAHLNHGMRAEKSDSDEKLVHDYALYHKLSFYSKKLSLKSIKSNFQSEARKLRYDWLKEIARINKFDLIATAHHLDDQIENFFLRINRNSGLNGLSGIKHKNGSIIRPMMFCNKQEILEYGAMARIEYGEDETNSESKYSRNFYRNEIIPAIEKKYPDIKHNILGTIEKIKESNELITHFVCKIASDSLIEENGIIRISLDDLKSFPSPEFMLFLILRRFNLNRTQTDNLFTANSGSEVFKGTKIFLKNRNEIIIKNKEKALFKNLIINKLDHSYPISSRHNLRFSKVEKFTPPVDSKTVFVDTDKLILPLNLRQKQSGDEFFPIGMGMKSKKVKKMLTDLKLNIYAKEKSQILVDAEGKIIWILGIRADERFKIRDTTKNITKIEIIGD